MRIERKGAAMRALFSLGLNRFAGGLVALGLVMAIGGCEKLRQVVEKAAKKSERKEESVQKKETLSPHGAVMEGLGRLETAQKGRMATVAGGGTEIRHIGGAEFDSFVGREDRLVVIDFYADWCGPCRTLAPKLEQVCRELGPRVSLGKVDIDRNKELAGRLGVRSIPDVRIFRGGKQVDSFVGALGEEQLMARLTKQFAALPELVEPAAALSEAGAGQGQKGGTIVPMEKNWTPKGMERR